MLPLTKEQLKFYENIKFVHGGNNLWGADCFGIVKLINKREYGIDIGEYERTSPILACKSIDSYYKKIVEDGLWIPVQPYTGCTVVTFSIKIANKWIADHVGIYIEPGEILSTHLAMGYSKIVPIGSLEVLGCYEFNI